MINLADSEVFSMSDFVIHKGQRPVDSFSRHYGKAVKEVQFNATQPTRVLLADGREGRGSCVGCGHAPCMEKDPSELALAGELEAFPGDPSLDVCPTGAIVWDDKNAVATVNADGCIGCGLCVARCPYGAISLKNGEFAEVEKSDPNRLVTTKAAKGKHANPVRTGVIASLAGPAAASIPETVGGLDDRKGALLIRNLLHEVGLNARVRRRGDTNVRIDAVGASRSGRPFVAEIELSTAVLESPRALLEDVAIIHARYHYIVANIDALSIILSLPNVRSEYYQVMRDIESVLGLRCRTITVGALVALLWHCARLDGFGNDAFATGDGKIDLTQNLQVAGGRKLQEPYYGAFTPAK
jgi:ferredoxin